jgi:uncharacterized BrkB/YihY/UPF0761 family membrane protein
MIGIVAPVGTISADLATSLRFPPATGYLFHLVGGLLIAIGALAYWLAPPRRRQWGRRLVAFGALFVVIGANFPAYLAVVKYALP